MKTSTVKILGCTYQIRTSDAGEALLRVSQEIVDTKMQELRAQHPHQPLAQTAVIAGLDLVGEFLEQEQTKEDRLKRRLRVLIDNLNQS